MEREDIEEACWGSSRDAGREASCWDNPEISQVGKDVNLCSVHSAPLVPSFPLLLKSLGQGMGKEHL